MTTEQCGQDQLPIGLFDSGVGGLTVLDAMRRLMPGEDYLFLGDTARVPYGAKSQKTIVRYSLQAAAKLIGQRIKLLVIACNTATAAALPALRETWPDMPIIGVIEPGSRAACEASPSGDIAVIATESTIRSGAYAEAILRRRPEAQVRSLACPLFVPLAEEGWFDGPIAEGVVSRYLEPLFEKSPAPDCLVLGCTHYPMARRRHPQGRRTGSPYRGFRGDHGRGGQAPPRRQRAGPPAGRAHGAHPFFHHRRPAAVHPHGQPVPQHDHHGQRRPACGS